MSGILKPYDAFELITKLKETISIPIHMQTHATTGLSTATNLKAIEAGIDNIDTSISSMSMTYGHSPTETLASIFEGKDQDFELNMDLLEEIADHFKLVRDKYSEFEGTLRGVDSSMLLKQVPGGMLSNLESLLKIQKQEGKLEEIKSEKSPEEMTEEIKNLKEELEFYKSLFVSRRNSCIFNLKIKKMNGKNVWVDRVRDQREDFLKLDIALKISLYKL